MKNESFISLLSRILLFVLLTALTLGGFYGGAGFLVDPTGQNMKIPLSLLASSPFKDYLVPGILIFIIFFLLPILILIGLFFRTDSRWISWLNIYSDQHWSWTFSLYEAIILIIWMDIQIMMIGCGYTIQHVYLLLGVAILIVTLLPPVRNYYKK